jgi:hypothetical protein
MGATLEKWHEVRKYLPYSLKMGGKRYPTFPGGRCQGERWFGVITGERSKVLSGQREGGRWA